MHYGDPIIRKAVPLAIGLVSASNPQLPILDTLSKYSHDNDLAVAINAIFAMGLVGAGTNNARLAQMLRQLAGYYSKEPDSLFMVRIAQGLVHMGKGTIGINPFFYDRSIMSRPAVCGLLATLTAFTDAKSCTLHFILKFSSNTHYPLQLSWKSTIGCSSCSRLQCIRGSLSPSTRSSRVFLSQCALVR